MEETWEIIMPWLSARSVGVVALTCKVLAQCARLVTESRVRDVSQGWEALAVPAENHVDGYLYPEFEYTPFSRVPSSAQLNTFGGPWGRREMEVNWRMRGVCESQFDGAMKAGTVLHGLGIGCKCPNECTSRVDMQCKMQDWAGTAGSKFPVEGKDQFSASSRVSIESSKKRRVEEQVETNVNVDCSLSSHFEDQGQIEGESCDTVHKYRSLPWHALSCRCGRFLTGELAYDLDTRLLAVSRHTVNAKSSTDVQHSSENSEPGGRAVGQIDEPHLVMECGEVCSCSTSCNYRVSQKGLGVRVTVVRTSFKGWGLRAQQDILRGSFVCEYAGEVITNSEARRRHNLYDVEVHGTQWQGAALMTIREHLPSGQASVRLNVDATRVGNVARFVNHSCDGGNLMPCLIRMAGCIIPKLALFARRDISIGEELTYSYGIADKDADRFRACFCGTSACSGRLPSEFT